VTHEAHGTTGRYRFDGAVLHVAWERHDAEAFHEIDGIFVHAPIAPVFEVMSRRRNSTSAEPQSPPIQVVSLRRSPQRRARFTDLNAGLDYTFFDTVDGSQIDLKTFFGGPLAEAGVPYSPGAVGCALSHRTLWQKAANDGTALTIVEDDAVLHWDFKARSQSVLRRLPANWELIVWGWNFDAHLSLHTMPGLAPMSVLSNQADMRRSIRKFQANPIDSTPYRLDKCFGTSGYTISPAGARTFLANCFPLKNNTVQFAHLDHVIVNDGIDHAMNRIYTATRSFAALPPLLVTPNDHAGSLTIAEKPGNAVVTPPAR
jgi:GR25 family glycosyltransferase involved in LPS biosynthesis